MRNEQYKQEMLVAKQFIIEHSFCENLRNHIDWLIQNRKLPHSERWSRTYDFINEFYPDAHRYVVTGMVYYYED